LYLILILWMVLSSFFTPFSFLLLPFIFLLIQSERYSEVLITLFFTLILSDSLEESLAWAKSFKAILVIFTGLVYLLKIKIFEHRNPIIKYFLPFLIIAVICLAYSPVLVTSIQKTLSYFIILLIVPAFVLQAYAKDGIVVVKELVLFSMLIIVAGFLYKYINFELAVSVEHGGRLRGIFGNPNGLGLYLIVTAVLVVAIRGVSPGCISNKEYYLIVAIIVFIAIASGSRTSEPSSGTIS